MAPLLWASALAALSSSLLVHASVEEVAESDIYRGLYTLKDEENEDYVLPPDETEEPFLLVDSRDAGFSPARREVGYPFPPGFVLGTVLAVVVIVFCISRYISTHRKQKPIRDVAEEDDTPENAPEEDPTLGAAKGDLQSGKEAPKAVQIEGGPQPVEGEKGDKVSHSPEVPGGGEDKGGPSR